MSKVMGHLFLPPPWKSTFPPPVRLPPPLLLLGFFYMRTVQVLLTSRKNVIAHEKKNTRKKEEKNQNDNLRSAVCFLSLLLWLLSAPMGRLKTNLSELTRDRRVFSDLSTSTYVCVDFKNFFRWKNKNKVGTGKRRCVSLVKRERLKGQKHFNLLDNSN